HQNPPPLLSLSDIRPVSCGPGPNRARSSRGRRSRQERRSSQAQYAAYVVAATAVVGWASRCRPRGVPLVQKRAPLCWRTPHRPSGRTLTEHIGLLSALLDIPPHELLGVLLQDGVDLIQQVVDVLGQLLVPLGYLRIGLGSRRLFDLLVPAGLARLGLAAGVAGCHAIAFLARTAVLVMFLRAKGSSRVRRYPQTRPLRPRPRVGTAGVLRPTNPSGPRAGPWRSGTGRRADPRGPSCRAR